LSLRALVNLMPFLLANTSVEHGPCGDRKEKTMNTTVAKTGECALFFEI
jgi:hypothetical protein